MNQPEKAIRKNMAVLGFALPAMVGKE